MNQNVCNDSINNNYSSEYYYVEDIKEFNFFYNYIENKAILCNNDNILDFVKFFNIKFIYNYNDNTKHKIQYNLFKNLPQTKTIFIGGGCFCIKDTLLFEQGDMIKYGKSIV